MTLFPLVTADLADLLEDVEHVMLDFDGPIRAVFAGDSAPGVGVAPGALDVLAAAKRTERVVSIVSSGAREVVGAYLRDHDLTEYVESIAVLPDPHADLAEADPHLLTEALLAYAVVRSQSTDAARRTSVFVGGSVTDIEVAKAAGVRCIAFANELGWQREFHGIGADVVITDLHELAEALNARWDAQWCRVQGSCGC